MVLYYILLIVKIKKNVFKILDSINLMLTLITKYQLKESRPYCLDS